MRNCWAAREEARYFRSRRRAHVSDISDVSFVEAQIVFAHIDGYLERGIINVRLLRSTFGRFYLPRFSRSPVSLLSRSGRKREQKDTIIIRSRDKIIVGQF